MATIIVGGLVLGAVAIAAGHCYRQHRDGKGCEGCSGNCSNCSCRTPKASE